ncbi:hypothetical protein J6590_059236, partial [Homalodisca vitripennis]
ISCIKLFRVKDCRVQFPVKRAIDAKYYDPAFQKVLRTVTLLLISDSIPSDIAC